MREWWAVVGSLSCWVGGCWVLCGWLWGGGGLDEEVAGTRRRNEEIEPRSSLGAAQ